MSSTRRDQATSPAVAMTFGVLGPLDVRDGETLLEVRGPQERALLALLLTAPGRVFSVSAIITGIWGDDPPRGAERTVQTYISRLRRALPGDGASVVATRSPGYVAVVDPASVDAERFRRLVDIGRRHLDAGRPAAAAATLAEALRLWRGEAYAEFDAPFAAVERVALEELRLVAVEDRVVADLAIGAGPELVGELERLVSRHPWRERLWAQLMTALYRAGRQGDALRAFQRARSALVDELGVEPGPDLRAVEAMVLAQDSRLSEINTSHRDLSPELTLVGPTFVGREAELASLMAGFDRAAAGSIERVLVTGPHGMGKTRLLAELAGFVQARGGEVRSGLLGLSRPPAGLPILAILDDLQRASTADLAQLAEHVLSATPPVLVVGACVWEDLDSAQRAALAPLFRARLPVPPLQAADIEAVVQLYVSPEELTDAVAVVAAAGGVPLQVHAAASRYGEVRAAARVEVGAAAISGPRRRLASSREQVIDGVVELQRIRVLRAAHARRERTHVLCPYKGLAFFDVDDAPYFFGRERLIAQFVARLVDAPLLAVVGPSGSGKSSAVRAGLVAGIAAGVLPGSERWHVVLTTPTQPLPDVSAAGSRTLLVVDQMEELFTSLDGSRQGEYADWLATAALESHVSAVIAIRSDYYGHAAGHPRLADLLAANTVLVGEMTPDELKAAMALPAAAVGLALEPGLAETIVADVAGEPGGLPLVSTALLSLWERRAGRRLTLAAYQELGGVRSAVAQLAEAAYGQLTPAQQSVARRTLLRLADAGEGGAPVRRRAPIGEVAPDGDTDARIVLDLLAARRLLTVSELYAEVAHEALLREWPRLREWLAEDEAGRQLRQHLAPAAGAWQASGGEVSELYRGPRLAAALDWQQQHPTDLTPVEHDFLQSSRSATEADSARRRRSIRRLRTLAAGLAVVLVLALIAGAFAVDQRNDAKTSSFAADVRALQANALNEDRWDRALLYAAQAQRFDASTDSRAALLQTVQRGPEATAIFTAGQALHRLATNGDGTRLVASDSQGTLHVWDTASSQPVQTIRNVATFGTDSLDMSPDGRYVAVVNVPVSLSAAKQLKWHVIVVDLQAQPATVRFLPLPRLTGGTGTVQGITAARFTADGRSLVTVEINFAAPGSDGVIRYVDVDSGEVRRTLDFRHVGSGCLDMAAGRRFMVACNDDSGAVTAWAVDSGRRIWSSVEPAGTVAAISPDGSRLVIGHADGRIERIDVKTGDRAVIAPSLAEGLIDLTWSPDGSTFAGATQERTVCVWDADRLKPAAVLRGHWGNVSQVAYAPDGKALYATGFDGAVVAWDLTGTRGIVADVGSSFTPGITQAVLAPDGSVAAASYPGGRVEVFSTASQETFEVVSPDGRGVVESIDRLGRSVVLATIESGGGPRAIWIRTIDVRRAELLPYTIELKVATGWDAVPTWNNETVIAAVEQNVGLWDRTTGAAAASKLFTAADTVVGVAMHPDGRLAALSESGRIEVIDLTTGELVATMDHRAALGERTPLRPIVFSPNGRWLAAATRSGQVVVWDTRTWKQHETWAAVPGLSVSSMVFTAGSDFVVTGGAGRAAIWNVEQGASGGVRLDVDPGRPNADVLVGVRDDDTLVTFTDSTGLRVWDLAPERLLAHACKVVGRNLTQQEWRGVLPNRPYERTCPQHPSG